MNCWKSIRKQVLERDNNTCQRCFDNDKKPVVHHKIPQFKGGPDTPDNLMSVCDNCHSQEHMQLRRGDIEAGRYLPLTKLINGNVDSNTAREFKALCQERGISPIEGVRRLIEQELERVAALLKSN